MTITSEVDGTYNTMVDSAHMAQDTWPEVASPLRQVDEKHDLTWCSDMVCVEVRTCHKTPSEQGGVVRLPEYVT